MTSKINAKFIFKTSIAPLLLGNNSDNTIEIFSQTSFNYFYNLPNVSRLQEREIASLVGFKDEFFVGQIIKQVIEENNLGNKFYCRKVTANRTSGIKGRTIILNGENIDLTFGGDCVVYVKSLQKEEPILIVECKEYIDMIRMKELIGEAIIIKENISNSITKYPNIKFWVFTNVLELTEGWAYLFNNSDIRLKIDNVFVGRLGKRKDRNNKPQKNELIRFRDSIRDLLLSYK